MKTPSIFRYSPLQTRSSKSAIATAVLCGSILAVMTPAHAATYTWTAANSGLFNNTANWMGGALPGTTADTLFGDVTSTSGVVRSATDTSISTLNSITITQSTSATTGTNKNQVILGTSLTLTSATPLIMSGASAAGLAIFDLNGKNLAFNSSSAKTLTFGNYTILANTTGSNTTPTSGIVNSGGALTLNFNGGQLAGNAFSTGTGVTVNVTKGMGGGTLVMGANGGTALNTLNLNATGALDLGSTIVNYSNIGATGSNGLAVTVANTMTGLSSGVITTQLVANAGNPLSNYSTFTALSGATSPAYLANAGTSSLNFASGGTGFTFSGGIIDIRTTLASSGQITTNGNNITINSGGLAGNSLVASSGTVTLAGGQLALTNVSTGSSVAVNYTIADSGSIGSGKIVMAAGSSGTLSVNNTKTASTITIPLLSSGGTWNRGTINADSNYTIVNSASSGFGTSGTFASFTIADNNGLNGLAMGNVGIPTLLTLGANSSFYVASSTAQARTYEVGPTGAGNNVITPGTGSGGFTFGITNNTTLQTIDLNRDKGSDNITLINNGTGGTGGGIINLTVNQTGTANLYVSTRNLVLNAGVDFGGTGGIMTDSYVGNTVNDSVLTNAAGSVANAGPVAMTFTVNGSLSGTNTISLNPENLNQGALILGSTASVGGVQNWTVNGGTISGTTVGVAFGNNLTDASKWAGNVSLRVAYSGKIEASTNISNSTNFKVNNLTLYVPGTTVSSYYALQNSIANDGTAAGEKEALYTGTLSTVNLGDGSNGKYLFNLAGQDLYIDSFANYAWNGQFGLMWMNDAVNTVSQIKALTSGNALASAGFQVINGATLQVVGGNYNGVIESRSTGTYSADTAAAPNGAYDVKTTLGYNGVAGPTGAFQSFLGSGVDKGGNAYTSGTGTGGTVRVIGGHFTSSGYILNPVGSTGLIDTTGVSGSITDTTLDDVIIRAGASQVASAVLSGGVATFTPSTKQMYSNGDIIKFSGTVYTGMSTATIYYVVNATATGFQISTTPGGAPLSGLSGSWSGAVQDLNLENTTAYPALIVAGTTTVNGNMVIAASPGATGYQATLRVGGDSSTGYSTTTGPTAHAGSALLNVTGDFSTETISGTSVNVAIQSNASVKVGGNVSIQGVGNNIAFTSANVTGMDGVGINAASNFTLNGNKGSSAPQTVNIVPTVGKFHIGDGSGGTLSGTAAQAKLVANLTAAGNVDINGKTSSLDLGGKTLTLTNGANLTVGGTLGGNGTVSGGKVIVASGGNLAPGNSPGVMNFSSTQLLGGSQFTLQLNTDGLTGVAGTNWDQLNLGALDISDLANDTGKFTLVLQTLDSGNAANLLSSFDSNVNHTWSSVITFTSLTGSYSSSDIVIDATLFQNATNGSFSLVQNGNAFDLQYTAVPEPSTWAAMIGGFAMLFFTQNLRRRKQ